LSAAGPIGGGIVRQLGAAGHGIKLSFSRDVTSLEGLANEIGEQASWGMPAEAAQFGELVVISVLWSEPPPGD
jgi:predicted dinucleotide-binding enzyme